MAVTCDDAFLEDIAEHPDDDAPRLVYADWLDEHDEPARAEFIRLQCRLARLPPGDPKRRALETRSTELRNRHEAAWLAGLPALEGVSWEDFSRGFVEAVHVQSVEVFLDQAAALFAAVPVRRLHIGRVDDDSAQELAQSPYLARLSELNLGNNTTLGPVGVRALAASPHLANLTCLLLHYCNLGDEAVAALAGSPHLGRLVELYLSGNDLGDEGTVALGRSRHLSNLITLDLRDNRVSDAGVRSLAFEGRREPLTTLYLVNNRIGPEGAEALAFSTELPRLARLYLNYNPLGDRGATAISESPHRKALRDLDLRHCHVRDHGACALAGSPHLDRLDLLWLTGNHLRRETVALLRRRFGQRVRF